MSQGQRVLQQRSDLSGFRCPAAIVLRNTPVYMHRASGVDAEKRPHVPAQNLVQLVRLQEVGVVREIVEALLVGAKALDVRHVGTPDELPAPVAPAAYVRPPLTGL